MYGQKCYFHEKNLSLRNKLFVLLLDLLFRFRSQKKFLVLKKKTKKTSENKNQKPDQKRDMSKLLCFNNIRCKSFNFLSVEKICELNDADRDAVEVPGYVQVGQTWVASVDGLVPYQESQYFSRDYFTLKSKVSYTVWKMKLSPFLVTRWSSGLAQVSRIKLKE